DIPADRREDPAFARTNGEDGYRDGCRVPIPWTDDAETNYGFSEVAGKQSWLPQPNSWVQLSVKVQQQDPNSSLKFYQSALKLRKELTQLGDGYLTWLDQDSTNYLAFQRDDLVIACNPSDSAVTISLPAEGELLIASDAGVVLNGAELTMPSDSAVWVKLTN
ncbi:MAG: DUF3459 domain-containing protein, partial [Candidatus Nanopelagicales bacterium]